MNHVDSANMCNTCRVASVNGAPINHDRLCREPGAYFFQKRDRFAEFESHRAEVYDAAERFTASAYPYLVRQVPGCHGCEIKSLDGRDHWEAK